MIGKQNIGRGFRGTLSYVLGKEGAERLGGNMLGETPAELTAEFSETRKLKPNLSRVVYHTSLSAAPGEKLSDEKWNQVAGSYLKEMGFENSQYVVVRHTDTPIDHVHIVASRVGMDGQVVSDSKNFERSEKVLRAIELEHGLERVAMSRDVERRAPTRGEIQMAGRGEASTKLQLQSHLDEILQSRPATMNDFFEMLGERGIEGVPNVASTGHVSGISFVLSGEQMKGSDLGRKYTWAGLQKQGVNYDPSRDRDLIQNRVSEITRHSEERGADQESDLAQARTRSPGGPDSRAGATREVQQGSALQAVERGIRGGDEAADGVRESRDPSIQRRSAEPFENDGKSREDAKGSHRGSEMGHEQSQRKHQNNQPEALDRGSRGTGVDRGSHYRFIQDLAAQLLKSKLRTESLSRHDSKEVAPVNRSIKQQLDWILGVNWEEEEKRKQLEREEFEKQKRLEREIERKKKRALERERDGPEIDF